MVTVAVVVYAVFGKTFLFAVVAVGSLVFFLYRDKITWLINSDSLVSRLGRSIVVPFACASMGPLGVVALGFVNTATSAMSEWSQYRLRVNLESEAERLGKLNDLYRGIIDGFKRLGEQFNEQLDPIFKESDGESVPGIDATVEQILAHVQGRVNIIYTYVKEKPGVKDQLAAHARLQTAISSLYAGIAEWEQKLDEYKAEVDASIASHQIRIQMQDQVKSLLDGLREIASRVKVDSVSVGGASSQADR
jgi:hypothetical protein